ncbi:MAG: Lrp/AsnC ligand binding domain-containing protein [Crenarchaeota archaeon]|nr:Lrp/AsnC ligand binding domain-containing protein [Thermoproteota archaeon]MDW8034008.1 Lrp/AsnC ligand binding domain-containing protein [Nitrososphaerota archaeon]
MHTLEKPLILDTTLREGLQTPKVYFTLDERITILQELDNAGIDFIEIGSPYASEGEKKLVEELSKIKTRAFKVVHCRALESDVDTAPENVEWVALYLSPADRHLEAKFDKIEDKRGFVLKQVPRAISYAKSKGYKVRYTAEDAFRADPVFLKKVVIKAVEAGADSVSLPDTSGGASLTDVRRVYGEVISFLREAGAKCVIEAHFHNDMGMALANTLEAWMSGARILHGTINALGERAGIPDTLVLATWMKVKFGYDDYDLGRLIKLAEYVSKVSGIEIPPNQPISGSNVFTHTAGTHQKAVFRDPLTYQPFDASLVGRESSFALGPMVGSEGVKASLKKMGVEISMLGEEVFEEIRDRIKSAYLLHGRGASAMENIIIAEVLNKTGMTKINIPESLSAQILIDVESMGDKYFEDFCREIIAKNKGVTEIIEIWGSSFDYIVRVEEVPSLKELDAIVNNFRKVRGVLRTETLITGKKIK